MNNEISDLFGKPNPDEKGIWDTGFTIEGDIEFLRKIVDSNGKESGYIITGESNPKIINKEGKTIAYIEGHMHKRICNRNYEDTGYFISGKESPKICYYPKKREL